MLRLSTTLTSAQVREGDPWDLIYVPAPEGKTVRMSAQVSLRTRDGVQLSARVEDIAQDNTIGVEVLTEAELRQQAAEFLSASLGGTPEEWLV